MQDINILEALFDNKKIRIIKLFLRDKEQEFYLREISKLTGVPVATTYRIVRELVTLHLIREVQIRKFKVYILNSNKNVEYLDNILKEETRIIDIFVDEARKLQGVESIVQHGEEQKNKVNLLIIGTEVDPDEIKRICAEIKEKYKFNINSLTLTHDQYEQMSSMGLYSGKKVVLFGR